MSFNYIDRCAILAWDPKYAESSFVVCGSIEHQNYDNKNPALELFFTNDVSKPIGKEHVSSSFNKLVWTCAEASNLIVGGLNDGSVSIWDAHKLSSGDSSLLKTVKLYDQTVGGLAQSGFQGNLLVTGSLFGQIHLWDLNKADKQSELRFEEPLTAGVTDLSWNRKVPHIVAVASSAGKVSILDLRSRKAVASFTLPEPESSVSSLSWSPSNTTSIIVSNSSDNSPHLYNWDLKAPNAAQMTFSGHSSGVLSTFWSIFQDYDVLLSSSKDGSVISWNTADGSLIKQLEKRDSSVFKVTLCPDNSGLYASCGLDEKVNIFSYQDLLHADQEQTGTKVPSEDIVFNSAELSTSPSSESSIGEDSTTNDDPAHAQSPNSAKGEQGIPPIDVALGTGSICSIFSSGLRDAALVKAVSDECRAVSEEVSAFENMLANTDPGSACKTLIGPEADGRVWRLVSVLFAQDFNNELLEFIEAAHHHYSTGQQSTQLSLKTGSFDIVPLNEVDADEVIKEKLIEFDIHGAVSACLSANRHTDALIIASCHGPELRDEVESYIFKHSSSPYMKIACALRLRDFTDLIDDSSDDNWKQILSLLIHHSDPEKFVESCLRLAERLSSFKSEEAYLASATSFLVAGDLYRFAEQLLAGLIKDDDSHSESDLKCQCSSVFTAYRFIRFMQFYSYEFLSSITDEKLKNRILDVILKMKYILLLSGSESIISEDFTQFSSQFIDQDVNLDLLIEKLFVFNESHDYVAQSGVPQVDEVQPIPPSIQPQPTVEGLGYPSIINPAEAAIVNPTHMTQPIEPAIFDAAQPSQAVFDGLIQPVPPTAALAPNFAAPAAQIHSALPVMSPPQLVQPNPPPISPTWSPEGSPATYNDAPIINPRGFALTPDITSKIGSLSIAALDENEIQNAIQVLISTADQKSQGVQRKMVADWGSKLSAADICSGSCDQTLQSSIATLFHDISVYNWNSAAIIAGWIVTTSFSETKSWILNVKRLLDIAKH